MSSSVCIVDVGEQPLVYDPSIQLAGCPHVFLWNPRTGGMDRYLPAVLRENPITRLSSPNHSPHSSRFIQWKVLNVTTWLEDEQRYYQSREQSEAKEEASRLLRSIRADQLQFAQRLAGLSPEERHRELLNRLGKPYLGIRPASSFHRRVTHCYACKSHLDNSINIECVACGWILCACGACGCGYVGFS